MLFANIAEGLARTTFNLHLAVTADLAGPMSNSYKQENPCKQ